MPTSTPLWRLEEAPDLFLDSYVADGDRAVFLSLWGRDTAVHELLAKLTLTVADGGWSTVTLQREGQSVALQLDRDRLAKRTTRTYRRTRFGSLLNLWLYDQRCQEADRANRQCYALLEESLGLEGQMNLLWARICDLAAFPLLDERGWRATVMQILMEHQAIRWLGPAEGRLAGVWMDLSSEAIIHAIGDRIRTGSLPVTHSLLPSCEAWRPSWH